MKRNLRPLIILCLIFLLISLIGCKGSNIVDNNSNFIKDSDPENGLSEEENRENIMRDFRNTIESNNEPFEIIGFIDENIDKVIEEEAVEMIDELEQIQRENVENYREKLFAEDYQEILVDLHQEGDMELIVDESLLEEIENPQLKELLSNIIVGKYKLINMEASVYPLVDYEELKVYDKYLSNEMVDYIGIMAVDSNFPTVLNAGLAIKFDELGDRIIKIEKYVKNYPESIKKEQTLRLYGSYLKYYMEGVDNTPIYDYKTEIIKDEVLENYKKTSKIKDFVTSRIISEYLDIIEENEFKIDNSVLSKITMLYNDAIGSLENYR